MNTTINPSVDYEPMVKVVQPSVTVLRFVSEATTLQEANRLWRRAIGFIPSLNNSIVSGKSNLLAAELGSELKQYQQYRRFATVEEMVALQSYVDEIIRQTPAPHPRFVANGKKGFAYQTVNERAAISIAYHKRKNTWMVSGWARFCNPEIAERNFRKEGFAVYLRTNTTADEPMTVTDLL